MTLALSSSSVTGWQRLAQITALLAPLVAPAASPRPSSQPVPITLEECIRTALTQNREIQIERVQPRLAQLALAGAAAAYDPVLFSDTRWENLADSGGFDPADFSRDAIYQADTEVSRMGLTGLGPLGLSYSLSTDYAHSVGLRNGFDFDSYSLRLAATVRQPLLKNLWIDQARYTLRSNSSRLRSARWLLEHRVMAVLHRTADAYQELVHAQELVRTQERLRATRETLLAHVQRLVDGGKLSRTDATLAAAESAASATRVAEARHLATLADHALKTLLGHTWTLPTPAPVQPVPQPFVPGSLPDLSECRLTALSRRPDLAHLRQETKRAHLDVRYWRNQLFPALDLVGSYGRRGSSTAQVVPPFLTDASFAQAWEEVTDGNAPNHGIGFILSLPLSRKRERSQYRASQELRALAELRTQQHEELILHEIADAHAALSSTTERIELTRQARGLAEDALAAEERRLGSGTSTIFVVLQLQAALAAAQLQESRTRTDHLQALNRLEFARGTILDAHQIAWSESTADEPTSP
ncbi:MAG: TolC family protein [Verrucomicrobiales bacterium]|nr:TolC family protein [Verrucomicrobiales bacterium]